MPIIIVPLILLIIVFTYGLLEQDKKYSRKEKITISDIAFLTVLVLFFSSLVFYCLVVTGDNEWFKEENYKQRQIIVKLEDQNKELAVSNNELEETIENLRNEEKQLAVQQKELKAQKTQYQEFYKEYKELKSKKEKQKYQLKKWNDDLQKLKIQLAKIQAKDTNTKQQ